MAHKQRFIVLCMIFIFSLEVMMMIAGSFLGHEGLFEFGKEIGKYTVGVVLGALASAFAEKADLLKDSPKKAKNP
jgi:hypothetical protein